MCTVCIDSNTTQQHANHITSGLHTVSCFSSNTKYQVHVHIPTVQFTVVATIHYGSSTNKTCRLTHTQNMDASKSFFFTKTAIVIPTVTITGSLSFLSSFAIVVFVIRSRSNTVYHRILFVMSLFDMMSSLAIALTTLPMDHAQ